MFSNWASRCTGECWGTIVRFWRDGEVLGHIEVVYEVNGTRYRIEETLKVKSEAIKLGPIPVGMRVYAVLEDASVGVRVAVRYDPQNPSRAFVRDNRGVRNI